MISRLQEGLDACQLRACGILGSRWLHRRRSPSQVHSNHIACDYVSTDDFYSNFIPTCSECSTAYPPPGVVSVRGESTLAHCRECHRKMCMFYYLRLKEVL